MEENLAFHIVNDLLNGNMIGDDVSPSQAEAIVQARLNLDRRFRSSVIIHLARSKDYLYPGGACCGQAGNVQCSEIVDEVTCKKCLTGYGNSISPTGISHDNLAG